jgi:hypothetical protein
MRPLRPFAPVAFRAREDLGPGQEPAAPGWVPGDLVLTHGSALTSQLIRFGQALRIHGDDRRYTHWNHAAIVVDRDGAIIEALGRGITETHVSKYREEERTVLTVAASADDREQVVRFCRWAAGHVEADGTPIPEPDRRHQRYGWIQIASITLTLLTGARFTFSLDGTQICSGLAGRALERTGAIFNRAPSHLMPADLAKYFDPGQEPEGA